MQIIAEISFVLGVILIIIERKVYKIKKDDRDMMF